MCTVYTITIPTVYIIHRSGAYFCTFIVTDERFLLIFAELLALLLDLVFLCICMNTVRCKRSEYVKNVNVATC